MKLLTGVMLILAAVFEGRLSAEAKRVTRSDFGADWPLTVESGILECQGGAVTFRHNGVLYAVNGTAMTFKRGKEIDPIWTPGERLMVRIQKGSRWSTRLPPVIVTFRDRMDRYFTTELFAPYR